MDSPPSAFAYTFLLHALMGPRGAPNATLPPQRVIVAARTVFEIYDLMMYCPDDHLLDPLIVGEACPGSPGGPLSSDHPLKVASSYTAPQLAARLPPPVQAAIEEDVQLEESAEDSASSQSGSSRESATYSDSDPESESDDDSTSAAELQNLWRDFNQADSTERRSIMEAILGQDVPGAGELYTSMRIWL